MRRSGSGVALFQRCGSTGAFQHFGVYAPWWAGDHLMAIDSYCWGNHVSVVEEILLAFRNGTFGVLANLIRIARQIPFTLRGITCIVGSEGYLVG